MPKEEKLELSKEDSELVSEDKSEKVGPPDYSSEEKEYLSNLQTRLETARNKRDDNHVEFEGLTYLNYWKENRREANARIKPKKNKADTRFNSGTLRTKMKAVLSYLQGLNLEPDIKAQDKDDFPVAHLGNAMEDILLKTRDIEQDKEKQLLRQYTLLEQGHIFIEEMWDTSWEIKKTVKKKFTGDVEKAEFSKKAVKGKGEPKTRILSGPSVYLGSMKKYNIEDQPYIFTSEEMSYQKARKLYGDWDRFEYVEKSKEQFSGSIDSGDWLLNGGDSNEGKVEVIKYQDKSNNEFQILVNGIPMLPMGYPLTAIRANGEYTITQQNLIPHNHEFAYGKSFVFGNKNLVAILDEMMRLAVLKTQKSFMPPYINTTSRILSRDVLMPGKITNNLRKGALVPISEHEVKGVTSSEFDMMQEVKRFINENTVSPTFSGVKEQGDRVTATQIMQVQRQAQLMMSITTLAASLMERKLSMKRICTLLEHWFEPDDEAVDASRAMLSSKYRSVSRQTDIEGEGKGVRRIQITENIPQTSQEVKEIEERYRRTKGMPVRLIFVHPKQVKNVKLQWTINVNAKPKKSSELSKMMFSEMINQAMALGLPLNPDYISQRFAQVWDEDPSKMFKKTNQMQPGMSPEGQAGAKEARQRGASNERAKQRGASNTAGVGKIRPSVNLQAERGQETQQLGTGNI